MTALETAQPYIRAMEAQDKEAVAETLAPEVMHLFPVAGEQGWMGTFQGRDEVRGYVAGFVREFRSLAWVDKRWTEPADRRTVFVEARGDAVWSIPVSRTTTSTSSVSMWRRTRSCGSPSTRIPACTWRRAPLPPSSRSMSSRRRRREQRS